MLDLLSLDHSVYFRLIIASAAGAFVCLDKIVLQIMLSRPLVAATIVGTVMGTPLIGATAGALIEIFWANKSPLGTYTPPNDTLVSIIMVITLSILEKQPPWDFRQLLVLSVLVYLPLGIFYQKCEILPAWFNNRISEKMIQTLDLEKESLYSIGPLSSLVFYFCFSFVLIVFGLVCGFLLIPFIVHVLPTSMSYALCMMYYVLPLIGISVVLTTTQQRKTPVFFAMVFFCCTLLAEILRSI
jgi:PTS system mannose-specific IIC component